MRERRHRLRHPANEKPELLATVPDEVSSGDITKLHGPMTWSYVHLYVLFDIYSRNVVGWLLADCESGAPVRVVVSSA